MRIQQEHQSPQIPPTTSRTSNTVEAVPFLIGRFTEKLPHKDETSVLAHGRFLTYCALREIGMQTRWQNHIYVLICETMLTYTLLLGIAINLRVPHWTKSYASRHSSHCRRQCLELLRIHTDSV